jgi:hypothetical protein
VQARKSEASVRAGRASISQRIALASSRTFDPASWSWGFPAHVTRLAFNSTSHQPRPARLLSRQRQPEARSSKSTCMALKEDGGRVTSSCVQASCVSGNCSNLDGTEQESIAVQFCSPSPGGQVHSLLCRQIDICAPLIDMIGENASSNGGQHRHSSTRERSSLAQVTLPETSGDVAAGGGHGHVRSSPSFQASGTSKLALVSASSAWLARWMHVKIAHGRYQRHKT